MGKHQVSAILPILAANHLTPTILFLHNNAAGPAAMIEALGRERVLLGFSGAGGRREGHRIDYLLIRQQPTTLGELDGRTTPRLEQIATAFKEAGFPTAVVLQKLVSEMRRARKIASCSAQAASPNRVAMKRT